MRERDAAGVDEFQVALRDGADGGQRHIGEVDDLRNGQRIEGEKQFIILPIRQRMKTCRNPVPGRKRLGIGMDWQPRRVHFHAYA